MSSAPERSAAPAQVPPVPLPQRGERIRPASPQRLAAARNFAIEAARLAVNTRCVNVQVMDLAGLSPVTDFFVLATGTSPRQMRTVIDEIEELGDKTGFAKLSVSGYEGESWIVGDFIDVVVHVFSHDARSYYDLDNLWGDARKIEWDNRPPPAAVT